MWRIAGLWLVGWILLSTTGPCRICMPIYMMLGAALIVYYGTIGPGEPAESPKLRRLQMEEMMRRDRSWIIWLLGLSLPIFIDPCHDCVVPILVFSVPVFLYYTAAGMKVRSMPDEPDDGEEEDHP